MPRSPTSPRRATQRETETPWFPVAIAVLFAVGCAADARRRHPPEPPTPSAGEKLGLRSLSFQIDADSELYEDAQKAAAAWSLATGNTITATPDGVIPILLVEDLAEGCEAGPNARGCSYVVERPEDGWMEIDSSVHWSVRYGVLLHEMGHHLRGLGGHLAGVPGAVMAEKRGLGDTTLLPEDVRFICDGNRMTCPVLQPSRGT